MQNHPIYKTTPEEGWSQMLPALDKAMPVTRRSRRFPIFWWAAAAVVLAIVLTKLAVPQHIPYRNTTDLSRNENISSSPATTEKVSSDIKKAPSTTVDQNISSVDPKQESHISAQSNQQFPGESISSARASIYREKQLSNQNDTPIAQSIISEYEKAIEEKTPLNQISLFETIGTEQNQTETIGSVSNTDNAAAEQLSVRDQVLISALPGVELDVFPPSDFAMHPIQPAGSKTSMRKKFLTPHVDASILETYPTGFAAYAGGGLDFNVLPRLSITTGIGCSIYNPELVLSSSGVDRALSEDTESLLKSDLSYQGIPQYIPAEAFSNSPPAVLTNVVSTIRQWHLHAGLKYDVSKRFYVEGGASLNMLSTVYSKYPIISVLLINNPSTGGNLDVSHNLEDLNVIASRTTSLYAGLGYRPGKKTEVFAQWIHGMDSYLKDSQLQNAEGSTNDDYLRGLSLGVRYNL